MAHDKPPLAMGLLKMGLNPPTAGWPGGGWKWQEVLQITLLGSRRWKMSVWNGNGPQRWASSLNLWAALSKWRQCCNFWIGLESQQCGLENLRCLIGTSSSGVLACQSRPIRAWMQAIKKWRPHVVKLSWLEYGQLFQFYFTVTMNAIPIYGNIFLFIA